MNSNARILIVDDSPNTIEVIRRHLATQAHAVFSASSVAEAIGFLEETPVDVVLTDMKMPEQSGMDLVKHVHDAYPDTQIVMITGYATVDNAVEAVKSGADGYLAKPFTRDELLGSVSGALKRLHNRTPLVFDETGGDEALPGVLGQSTAMRRMASLVRRIAASPAGVLVTGESGSGKELVARAIHYLSDFRDGPFVAVNCGAIPSELQESELFGHERGAFTGADRSRHGYFKAADGGSVFLDEIGETVPSLQVKLLRVLQDHIVVPVGSRTGEPVNLRVIAATNRDLAKMVELGQYRDDLFYRLSVVTVDVPPLRDRGDDIVLLARTFIEQYATEANLPVPRLTDRAVDAIRSYPWPGNVRELENIMHRMVLLSDGDTIDRRDLPEAMHFSIQRKPSLERTLRDVELDHIQRVLDHVEGNKSEAARILGIDRKTLREKLKSIGP